MQRTKSYKIAIRAVLIALIMIQSMTPFLGFIPLGFMDLTIIHITVIVAAIALGPGDGALIGLIWGIGTVIRAYTSPTSVLDTMVFTNPVVSIIPRILVGYLSGLFYKYFKNRIKSRTITMGIAAAIGSLTNTVLVLVLMRLMYAGTMASVYKVPTKALNGVIMTIIGTNGVPEMIAAIIIVPIICTAIFKGNKFLDN